eukprot:TRINITY_DN44279_c0_g1_i1.p1 TRINITY_DN44279_c0_g1~~TRINITY_DN44279_c0_g1_i1.p1  ORF type:complete len:483 (+),score=42.81 TRINITY_DN44279_c0_g1_i1:43-1449(+)
MAPSSGVLSIPPGADALEWMYREGLTDGLPVVVPTRGKVRKMLSGTSRASTHILGKMPPSYHDVSVEHVAIAAVMAGCEPKHFSVVIAGAEAFLAEAYGLHSTLSTTQGASQFLVVNGPARERCEINFKHGVLGSGHRANATICRALKLLLNTRAGSKLGGTESSTLGNPLKYGQCIAEWEERCPAWVPHHVEMGFKPSDSVVTAMVSVGGPVQVVDFGTRTADDLIKLLAQSMQTLLSSKISRINEVLLVCCPEHYDTLVNGGISSKQILRERLFKQCYVEKYERSGAKWDSGSYEQRLGISTSGPKLFEAASLHIIVAGAPAGKFSAFLPSMGWGTGRLPKEHEKYGIRSISTLVEEITLSGQSGEHCPELAHDAVVLDPRGVVDIPDLKLCGRGPIEAGATFALVDISKPGGNVLLDKLEVLLTKKFPAASIRRYRKPTVGKPVPLNTIAEIQRECNYVITGLAD